MELVRVEGLTFEYPQEKKKALDQVSFSIEEGQFVLVFGTSGCGKTTLFRQLKRELAPKGQREGHIYFRGKEQQELSDLEAAAKIGFVQQNPESQIVMDKVWHELAFGLENLGVPQNTIRGRVAEMANFFGIQQWFHKNTTELSGGQKQLLNLASVLLMQPELIILDEPTSQLDPIAAADFLSVLRKLNRELGITILISEHRLEEVLPMADKVLVMEEGRILFEGKPRTIGAALEEAHGAGGLMNGLPSAMRIFHSYETKDNCPMTVREGRTFLQQHFHNKITSVREISRFSEKEEPKNIQAASVDGAQEIRSVTERFGRKKTQKTQPVICAEELWFRYQRELPDVLAGASLQVQKGEIIGILGGNGSGKTTLLNAIAGGITPYRGTISIQGKKIKEYKNGSLYRNNLALLPQDPKTVFVKQTIREEYQEIQKVMGEDLETFSHKTEQMVERLGIRHLMNKHPYDLSGGEQQKCALGKILLLEPKLLFLDEPTKGIDVVSKTSLGNLLKELSAAGVTILMVTHDVEFAAQIAHRCGLFFDGCMTALDAPRAFFKENTFYTTAASRISREFFEDAITCEEVSALCKENGVKS